MEIKEQTQWTPPPAQVPANEGFVTVPGARLWYWDTNGPGEAIVLLHPSTGSGAVWLYQQPVFAGVGYRVIGYSRRGHYRSDRGDEIGHGTAADDLDMLADQLGLERFHLVGSAAGGFHVVDYALSHPERLLSITLACTQGGAADPAYRKTINRVTPSEFIKEMSSSFRELGPSYRAGFLAGVAHWEALEHESLSGDRVRQPMANMLTWDNIERIAIPALMFTGDADLYMPPYLMREYASHLQNCETAVVPGSGHSAYWEQPEIFNALVLDFIGRHRAK